MKGSTLVLLELLEHQRESDIICISREDEGRFAEASTEILSRYGSALMFRMLPNGFEFAWNGSRIQIRTDAEIKMGQLICENLVIHNFTGISAFVTTSYWGNLDH